MSESNSTRIDDYIYTYEDPVCETFPYSLVAFHIHESGVSQHALLMLSALEIPQTHEQEGWYRTQWSSTQKEFHELQEHPRELQKQQKRHTFRRPGKGRPADLKMGTLNMQTLRKNG